MLWFKMITMFKITALAAILFQIQNGGGEGLSEDLLYPATIARPNLGFKITC